MKVLCLNIWQGRLGRVLIEHLENLDVDFACVQEAVDFEGKSHGLVTSAQKVGQSLGLDEQFFSKLISTKFGNKQLSFGNATYSRQPFTETATIFTRGDYTHDFDLDEGDYNVRAFQHAQLTLDGKKLNILNHHGHRIESHKLGDDETMRQINQIVEYIKKLDGAVILCGDFNLAPESESIKLLNNSLVNLSTLHSLQTTRSKLTNKDEACDYIFVNNYIQVKSFVMDDAIISDHNALILDFELL